MERLYSEHRRLTSDQNTIELIGWSLIMWKSEVKSTVDSCYYDTAGIRKKYQYNILIIYIEYIDTFF